MLSRSPIYIRNILSQIHANSLPNEDPDGLLRPIYPYRHCKEEIQTSEEINRENEKRVRIKFQSYVLAKKCRDSDSEELRWDHRVCF